MIILVRTIGMPKRPWAKTIQRDLKIFNLVEETVSSCRGFWKCLTKLFIELNGRKYLCSWSQSFGRKALLFATVMSESIYKLLVHCAKCEGGWWFLKVVMELYKLQVKCIFCSPWEDLVMIRYFSTSKNRLYIN